MPASTKPDLRKAVPRNPSGVTFQTRARTIDHLGRGQIADAPTAVSELWKNVYDAYAKDVALHIFDGAPEVALVVDDGAGMSLTTFRERWLVIGTESKIEDSDAEPVDTFGLSDRVRQGEKGIGRLSAAFLAPVTLVISKTVRDRFAAVLVDWRLFENLIQRSEITYLSGFRLPLEQLALLAAVRQGSEDHPRLPERQSRRFGLGPGRRSG
ncbi:hypothetical protein CO683_40935 [Bradyrhizobium ottawaense]|uniref:ATP-binding protein n=1 Tax=Bradyrhizobium ottawaense TaxID=931866 RepID=UPI000BE9475D|nr:ATP-binding protein [Bradyrhizobium ottawaense]PDT64008.1 hypothetical protein CO683_40935 [Bradyrhizobium ottawaense]